MFTGKHVKKSLGTGLHKHHKCARMHVLARLGHKNITLTQICVKLLKTGKQGEYLSRVEITLEEAETLIESGFEYVIDMQIG
ncbi:MAG: hypothetical protein JSV12_01880 [Candidatus Bathyarchaeota archaeon]|nr:MAG: hypothetical protein JSV12_01880 [Candidatus Bathyarchaeota archaeon]